MKKGIVDIFDYIIISFYQLKTQTRLKDEWQRRKKKMWASISPFLPQNYPICLSPSLLSCSLLPNFSSTFSASASGPLACSADSALSHGSCSQNYKWPPDCLSQEGFLLSRSISNGYGQHHASKLPPMLLGSSLCLLPLGNTVVSRFLHLSSDDFQTRISYSNWLLSSQFVFANICWMFLEVLRLAS